MPKLTASPWGPIQARDHLAPGIIAVCTASHGGIHLSRERLAQMDPRLVQAATYNTPEWFEEDCEIALVFYAFPELTHDRPNLREQAMLTIRRFYPQLIECGAVVDAIKEHQDEDPHCGCAACMGGI